LSRIACGCCFRVCGIANDSPDPVSHVRAASSAELIGYGLNRAAEIFNEATRCLWDLIANDRDILDALPNSLDSRAVT